MESYANSLLDHHVVIDLLPTIALLYFSNRFPTTLGLSSIQSAILLGIGLQKKDIDTLSAELNLPVNQTLAMFSKTIRKFSLYFRDLVSNAIDSELPAVEDQAVKALDGIQDEKFVPLKGSLEDDLKEAGDEFSAELKAKQLDMISSIDMSKYALSIDDEVDDDTLKRAAQKGGVVSVKSKAQAAKRKLILRRFTKKRLVRSLRRERNQSYSINLTRWVILCDIWRNICVYVF